MFQKKLYNNYKDLKEDAVDKHFTIYGDLYENNRFESIILQEQNYICGIVYYNYGIDSKVLPLNNTRRLFIGFGKRIIGIDCNTKKVLFQEESIAPFYEFIETAHCILAICELQVYAFDSECQLIWSSDFRDIIEDYHIIDGEKISISCSNGDMTIFTLKNGTPSN